jgi:hypothetical protein
MKPSDMVTLRGDPAPKFVRVYSDGSTQDPFSLPEGKVLVVTDIDPMPLAYGHTITIKVNDAIASTFSSAYSPHYHFTAGVVVSTPGLLAVEPPSLTQYIILRGYLTDDQ